MFSHSILLFYYLNDSLVYHLFVYRIIIICSVNFHSLVIMNMNFMKFMKIRI